jgi:hypothetical protein
MTLTVSGRLPGDLVLLTGTGRDLKSLSGQAGELTAIVQEKTDLDLLTELEGDLSGLALVQPAEGEP